MSELETSITMDEAQQQVTPINEPQVKLRHIARTFLGIGLASFSLAALGEAKNWMTKKRKWFTDDEYMQGLGLAQLLPGAPTVNLSSYLGFRLRGLPGAAVATTFFLNPMLFAHGVAIPSLFPLWRDVCCFRAFSRTWRTGCWPCIQHDSQPLEIGRKDHFQRPHGYRRLCPGLLVQNGDRQDSAHHRWRKLRLASS